jgi:Nitrile hydratase, alpha chain
LLANGRSACEELGITFYDDTQLIVLENTDAVHNLIVCTLCSCYPRPVLGLPPDWYKLKPYRARRQGAEGRVGRIRHRDS